MTDLSIKFYRKKRELRQSDLAKILQITNTDMSFIENKKIYPKAELAEYLSQALGVPIGKLYSEEELNLIIYKSREK